MIDEHEAEFSDLNNMAERYPTAWLLLALDVIEPIAPVAAGLLWILEPVAGGLFRRDSLRDLAEHLETPEGVETLRQSLSKQLP